MKKRKSAEESNEGWLRCSEGEEFLFLAHPGKRAAGFLLDKAYQVLANLAAGPTAHERLVASRLVRGYTSEDHTGPEETITASLADGGTSEVPAAAIWSLLGIDTQQPVVALDIMALHLAVLVIILFERRDSECPDLACALE